VKRLTSTVAILCTCVIFWPHPAAAAQRVETGTIEAGFGAGISGGLPSLESDFVDAIQQTDPSATLTDVSDTEWNVGGSVGVGIAENTLVKFEVMRTKVFSGTVNSSGESIDIDVNITEFTGGVEYLVEVDGPVVPFVGGALGVGRLSAGISGDVMGTPISVGISDSEAIYNLGGGVRAYLNERVGIRPDFRWLRFSGESFWRATVGVVIGLN
jgi:opacity protein-like surface antigen